MARGEAVPPASGRLAALARATRAPLPQILNQFVCERVLAAIGGSAHRERLVLHGAWSLGAWFKEMPRATRGLDLLDISRPDATEAVAALRAATAGPAMDGIRLDWPGCHVARRLRRPCALFRLTVEARVGRLVLPIRINVAQAKPGPVAAEVLLLPRPLLGHPRARVSCCTPEEMVAEKSALLVTYGADHTRLVDYLDLLTLADRFPFDGPLLLEAMRGTFRGRDAERMLARRDGYWEAALAPRSLDGGADARWARLLELVQPASPPGMLRDVVLRVGDFLIPALRALRDRAPPPGRWTPGVGWRVADARRDPADGQHAFAFLEEAKAAPHARPLPAPLA